MSINQKRDAVNVEHGEFSIREQCTLLGLARSSYYYKGQSESQYNQLLMSLIDEQYTRTPFYGSPRLTAWLVRQGHPVNIKRVKRLMGIMGLAAIYPTQSGSQPGIGHAIYPYLLRGVRINRLNQVWGVDITYIRLKNGFLYLVAIIDWFSRYVLSFRLSNTLDALFCVDALKEALEKNIPEIHNSDQGSQFTGEDYTSTLRSKGIQISMDGRGRALDNIFVERLWRSVKYENVYLNHYETPAEARKGIGGYFKFYNSERLHQSLNYNTPEEVYFGRKEVLN